MRRTVALVLALWLLLLCGCQNRQPDTIEQTQPAVAQPTQPETMPPVQTQPPTEPETQPPTQPPTEPAPESLLHCGIREDGTFDEGTLFIGDSLTNGLLAEYVTTSGLLGDARYMATPGVSLLAFFDGPRLRTSGQYYSYYSKEFEGMLMCEGAAAAGESVTAIYFMLGTNHNDYVTVQLYIDVLGYLLEVCPNATIYLQQVPCSTSSYVDHERINERIGQAYAYYSEQEEHRVRLIETQDAIGMNLKKDGVHITQAGQALWYQALVDYAAAHGIPQ